MPVLLNARWERFCREVLIDRNATRAYKTAFGVENQRTAEVNSCRLMKNAEVAKRIAELEAEYLKAADVDNALIIREIRDVALAKVELTAAAKVAMLKLLAEMRMLVPDKKVNVDGTVKALIVRDIAELDDKPEPETEEEA